ncbi:glycosyltransferase [Paraburkholderia sp. NMBU_R16]|uniref:glycosyltransferase family 2 protein n=1 Tax=Paraburkholderia sp. NMBU_R16 TaxID=2698676 RepID=UPI0015663AA3|nr:glycosyltransferase [Paraburkholderia sp. NMBU_R16]NRO96692.1 glycosyltransferase [Paraburkholderia sp. NMBU_R16]
MNTRISVVVLTYNRLPEVMRTVSQLLSLPEAPPVIVADNGSTDGTATALRERFPDIQVIECGANLGAAGRNRGAKLARTDYIAFSDDDTEWQPGALDEAVRILDSAPSVAVISGRVLVGESRELDPTCARMRASPLDRAGLPGPALVGYMAGACVLRAAVFRQVGGYEPRLFIGGEEALVALDVLDAGYAIVYCDSVVTLHRPSAARDASLRRRMLARNAALVAWLRLPRGDALTASFHAFEALAGERDFVRHAAALLRDIAWAMRRRRAVGAAVVRMCEQVRQAELTALGRGQALQRLQFARRYTLRASDKRQ